MENLIHEILFGALVTNSIAILSAIRLVHKVYKKKRHHVELFFLRHDLMWKAHIAKYPEDAKVGV